MNTEDTRQIIENFIGLMYRERKVREAFETYVADDYVQHNPDTEDGREATLKSVEDFYADHPECVLTIRRILVDGDIGVTHLEIHRTADDPGRAVVDMHRVEGGLIREHWDVIQEVPSQTIGDRGMF